MHKRDIVYSLLIVLYVVLFVIQINQPPSERYPGWDFFWHYALQAGKLTALKYALLHLELPSINPYVEFGWNNIGDTTLPQSFLSPLNLLILVFSPSIVLTIKVIFFLMVGGLGTYLYLRLLKCGDILSFLGALVYISIPFATAMLSYYHCLFHVFCLVPFVLLLTHSILERASTKKMLLFVALSILTVSSGDVFVLIILPIVVAAYSFLIALGYYRLGFLNSFKKTAYLVFLCLLSASFYILPLYYNLRTISSAMRDIRQALGVAPAVRGVRDFVDFFMMYGAPTLYKPIEGSGLLLYIPVFFYFVMTISFVLKRVVFEDNPRQAVIPLVLIALGLLMLFVGLSFYVMPAGISGLGRGVLRYQINLIPFVNVLAGFVCLAAINRSGNWKVGIYAAILVGSFLVDWLLFGVRRPYDYDYYDLFAIRHDVQVISFQSSNRVSVRFLEDMWLFLPWLNLSFVVLLFLHGLVNELGCTRIRRALCVLFVVCAIILPLLNVSVHNELRATQQSEWQRITRNPYRWDSYLQRKACIDGLVDRYDQNYRTLPAGAEIFEGTGRNWKFIAETELNVENREKVLFSYRETMHPYTALLYSTFSGVFAPSNWFPPLSATVPGNLETIRLMGVKWVISADETISSPDLIYRGECVSEAPPVGGWGGEGTVYIYELRNPNPISFLVDDYEVVSLSESLRAVFQNDDHPWSRGVVYLERSPESLDELQGELPAGISPGAESRAEIVQETFNSIEINVNTSAEKYLVLSYLYRPNWRAYLGTNEMEVYRAYGGFMAVRVPPGNYTIRFQYTPWDVYYGLALTALALILPVLPRAKRLWPFQ